MSEKPPSTSPETSPFHIEGAPAVLQIKAIDELRTEQQMKESGETAPYFGDVEAREKKREEVRATFDQMIEEHLKKYGVSKAEDEEKFREYANILRDYSIDRIPRNVWENNRVSDDGDVSPSRRVAAVDEVAKKYGKSEKEGDEPTTTEPLPPEKTDEEKKAEAREALTKEKFYTEARANVDKLRSELAALTAKRQGSLFTRQKKLEAYNEKKAEYQKALNQLTLDELNSEKAAGVERTEPEERMEIAQRLIGQFHALQTETVNNLKDTKVAGFIDWMTKGGAFKRFAKGALVGVGVGVVGAALTAFTAGTALGAVGAGIAAGGVMAGRFARGYAAADNKRGEGMKNITFDHQELLDKSDARDRATPEAADMAHSFLMNKLEEATNTEQGKRRRATVIGLGGVAMGALAAEGVNWAANRLIGHVQGAHDLLQGKEASLKPGITPEDVPDLKPDTPPIVPERTFSAEALNIQSGEGWYQTFQDLGIPQKDWPALLEKAGPRLHEMGLAYEMPSGQWGILMTPEGAMPKEALDVIMNSHDQMMGVNTVPVPVEAPVETPAPVPRPEVPAPQPEVNSSTAAGNESLTPTDKVGLQNIMMKQVITESDIANSAAFDKITTLASWYTPEHIAQELNLPFGEWRVLEDKIIGQVQVGNRLYLDVFNVDPKGYLHFNNIRRIPDTTMADMLNRLHAL